MKKFLILSVLLLPAFQLNGQKEKIRVPSYVNYKYCKPKIYTQANELVINELVSLEPTYSLVSSDFIIGPILWERLDTMKAVADIDGGKVTLNVDKKKFPAKYIQSPDDGKIIWDIIRPEFNGIPIRVRKASYSELEYYWAVIYYDIVEPLLIAETPTRKYILDLDPKTLTLEWLDEVPEKINTFLKSLNQ